jgi:hypothetical protein
MKLLRWITIVAVMIIAGFFGKIAGYATSQVSSEASKGNRQNYYAISTTLSKKTGRKIVSIVLTHAHNDCSSLLSGRRYDASNPANSMTIESQQCTATLDSRWADAFQNKPIPGAYYVAYINIVWPTRELFFDVDKNRSPQEICEILVTQYSTIDKEARCVAPRRY